MGPQTIQHLVAALWQAVLRTAFYNLDFSSAPFNEDIGKNLYVFTEWLNQKEYFWTLFKSSGTSPIRLELASWESTIHLATLSSRPFAFGCSYVVILYFYPSWWFGLSLRKNLTLPDWAREQYGKGCAVRSMSFEPWDNLSTENPGGWFVAVLFERIHNW